MCGVVLERISFGVVGCLCAFHSSAAGGCGVPVNRRCVLRAGTIPTEIGALAELTVLALAGNHLTGAAVCVAR
jgi:hypothetical protein